MTIAPMLVPTTIRGPLAVRVVDGTRNTEGFEWATTKAVVADLTTRGVLIESQTLAVNANEFLRALAAPGEFGCLLILSHGVYSTEDAPHPTEMQVGERDFSWQLLARINVDLTDKMVVLAVCGGYCPDALTVFARDHHLGLIFVGSRRSVSPDEVRAVIPALLREVAPQASVSPEFVRTTLNSTNVDDAFTVYSSVGFAD